MRDENPSELLLTDEAAQVLRVTPATLKLWRLRGAGPRFIKMGRRVAYRLTDLERYMTTCERSSTSDTGPAAA